MFSAADHDFMARALLLAERGLFTTTPNPRVGCVIAKDGEVVGEGWHRRAGEPHAEVVALAEAAGRARGATVYVTLEPCSHFGRTPPCVDALLEARVARVVAAMEDPNPRVNGRGLARLREAGVDVRCGLLRQEAEALNVGFVARMTRGTPWLRMKVAMSLDARTALPGGESRWITAEAARRDGHAWRARACTILTGIGTVRDDDPRLDVRLVDTPRLPPKVLVDARLAVDLEAKVLRGAPLLVATAVDNPAKVQELRDRGAEVVQLPDAQGKVDLAALLRLLGERGVNELHVEAGHRLNGSLLQAGLVDELLLYVAPSLLGEALPFAAMPPVATLADAVRWHFVDATPVGDDLRVRARRATAADAAPSGAHPA